MPHPEGFDSGKRPPNSYEEFEYLRDGAMAGYERTFWSNAKACTYYLYLADEMNTNMTLLKL